MAVQAQFAGLAGCGGGLGWAEEAQARALKEYGGAALLPAGDDGYYRQYDNCGAGVVSGAQSELTCNGGGRGLGAVVVASRKRGREAEPERFVPASSTAALLPIPGMHKPMAAQHPPPAVANRTPGSAMAPSTSGRPATAAPASVSAADALVAELCRQGAAEVDALVRAECEALRAGLARARKRQCQALAEAAAAGAARALRAREAELAAARRHAAQLEERLRQAAAEAQAWCGLARSNEAVAAGLRATLDSVLLRSAAAAAAAPAEAAEGFGDSDLAAAAAAGPAEDAQSGCFAERAADAAAAVADTAATPATRGKWACRGCCGAEASVLLLPCRHLCLCRACEPRADACPACLAAKTGAIHVAAD